MSMRFYADSRAPVSSAIFSATNTPGRLADQSPTAAQTSVSVGIPPGGVRTFGFLTNSGDPGVSEWPAGTYTVVVNQNGNTIDTTYTKVEILQVDSTGTTVKSVVGSISISQTTSNSVHTWNVAGVDTVVDPGDILAVRISASCALAGGGSIAYLAGIGAGTYVSTPLGNGSMTLGAAARAIHATTLSLGAKAAAKATLSTASLALDATARAYRKSSASIGAKARAAIHGLKTLGAKARAAQKSPGLALNATARATAILKTTLGAKARALNGITQTMTLGARARAIGAGLASLGAKARASRASAIQWVDRKYKATVVQRVTYGSKVRRGPKDTL